MSDTAPTTPDRAPNDIEATLRDHFEDLTRREWELARVAARLSNPPGGARLAQYASLAAIHVGRAREILDVVLTRAAITPPVDDDSPTTWRNDPSQWKSWYGRSIEDVEQVNLVLAALIHARREQGLSQQRIALHMPYNTTGVGELERGQRPATVQDLQRYAQAVGLRLEIRLVDTDGNDVTNFKQK